MSDKSPRLRRCAVVVLTALLAALPVVVWPSTALAEGCGILLLDTNDAAGVDGHLDDAGRSVHLDTSGSVRRHLPDRRPDAAFGDAGSRSLNDAVGTDIDGWEPLALLELSSRMVAVGHRYGDMSSAAVLVALTADGELDPAFGSAGVAQIDLPNAFTVAVSSAPDDGLVVLVREYGAGGRWGVARLVADGTPDAAFGAAGVAWFEETVAADPSGVLVHVDGRTVVSVRQVGETADPARSAGVVALSVTGELLDGFGTGGQVATPAVLDMRSGRLAAGADGSTLVVGAGSASDGTIDADVLVRVTPEGSVDAGFGGDGAVRFAGASEFLQAIDLAVDPEGRILLGRSDPMDPADVTVARVDADGSADSSFGTGGVLRHTLDDEPSGVGAVEPQPDGRLLVVARSALLTVEQDGTLQTDCPAAGNPEVLRLAGTDRYSTPVEVSRWAFPQGARTVFIATGLQFPDALAAVPAATRASAPVLLVQKDVVPAVAEQELARLAPDKIVVLGGPSAVSDSVVSRLRQHAGSVSRLAGTNRFETAAAISASTFAPDVENVYVATGLNFPDALAGGAAAGLQDVPILLVTQSSIPDATARELTRLSPAKITVLGGAAAVSEQVEETLRDRFLGGQWPERVAGSSRYATAAQIGERAFPWEDGPPPATGTTVFLATGLNFPDALSAGSAAALNGAPLMLVPPAELLEVVRAALTRLRVSRVVILGGTGAVGSGVAGALEVPGQLRHLFSELRSDREPVRWNPCEPIKWVWNPSNAPAGAFQDVQEAVSRVQAATGIPFQYEGESNEPARSSGSDYGIQRARYGDRPAPMLIAFGSLGGGFMIGLGGYTSVSDSWDGTGGQIFSGFVTLDSDRVSWPTGFTQGDATGPVLMHELGHALGLDHVDYADELMYPVSSDVLDLAAGDRRGLRTLGTGSPCLRPAAEAIEGLPGLRLTYVRRS